MNLKDEHGYQMSTYMLKKAMGCKPGPRGGLDWPDDGMNETNIDGTIVYVAPKGRKLGRRLHRAFAICQCGKHVPAGRLRQHMKSHKIGVEHDKRRV